MTDETYVDYVPTLGDTAEYGPTPKKDSLSRHKRRRNRSSQKTTEVVAKKCKIVVPCDPDAHSSTVTLTEVRKESDINNTTEATLATDLPESSSDTAALTVEQRLLEIDSLRNERDKARAEVKALKASLHASRLSTTGLQDNTKCISMTGLSYEVFTILCDYVSEDNPAMCTNLKSPPMKEKLFLTLVKLRHNATFELLAHMHGISKSCCISIYWNTIELLYDSIGFMVSWQAPGNRFDTIPTTLKELYPRLTSIIHCLECFIESPKNLTAKAQCYSSCKKRSTFKVLISCTPNGAVNYVSKCWGGRVSDVELVRKSGFISKELHNPHDQILAVRGFRLKDDFSSKCQAELIIPSFTGGIAKLSGREMEQSRTISHVRSHIARFIGLLKRRFTILKGVMPLEFVKKAIDERDGAELAACDKIVTVCSALINLGGKIVDNTKVE